MGPKMAWKRYKCKPSCCQCPTDSPAYLGRWSRYLQDKLGSLALVSQVDRYHAGKQPGSSQAVHMVDQQKSGMESRTGVIYNHQIYLSLLSHRVDRKCRPPHHNCSKLSPWNPRGRQASSSDLNTPSSQPSLPIVSPFSSLSSQTFSAT